jgi:sec-independent protein translocase protein TatA
MFGIGYQELIVVLAILLLFFGGRKLPELSRSIGKSLRELRHGLKDDEEGEKTASGKKSDTAKS